MTLAELLALLPDNSTGAIDAADLRTIVTELFNNTETLTEQVAVNTANISLNTDRSVANEGAISTLNTEVNDHEARIATLEAG